MAKISKEQQWRLEGISYAVSFLESGKSLEDLKADAKMRGAYGIPVDISKAEVDRFGDKVKEQVIRTILLMSCSVLQDEFGFGHKRIGRFMERFNSRTDAMKFGYVSWGDIAGQMEKEMNIQFELIE